MPFPSKGLVYDYQLDDGGASGRNKGDDDDEDDKKTSAGMVRMWPSMLPPEGGSGVGICL